MPDIWPALYWIVFVSAAMFVVTLIVIPILIVRLPADYFTRTSVRPEGWRKRHPLLRLVLQAAKNAVGLLVAIAGLIMLFTPGQGILAILLGLSMMDIPGKRAAEISILRRPAVLGVINRLRARSGRAPLELPPMSKSACEPDEC